MCKLFDAMKRFTVVVMVAALSVTNVNITAYAATNGTINSLNTQTEYYGQQAYAENEIVQKLYNALVKNYVEEKETGSFKYVFDEPLVYIASTDEQFSEYMQNIIFPAGYAMIMDYPELFWIESFEINNSISRSANEDGTFTFKVKEIEFVPKLYYDNATDDVAKFDEAVDAAVEEIKTLIAENTYSEMSDDAVAAMAIHDWLCGELEYSKEAIRTPSTVFIGDKKAICEGYSKAFKILCDKFGVTCILVNGESINSDGIYEDHMWNDVKIGDTWYGMDVSWDDQGTAPIYTYFLAGSNSEVFYDVYSVDHLQDENYWGDNIFIVRYPELSDKYYYEISTSIEGYSTKEINNTIYTGYAIEPSVTLSSMDKVLTKDEDYTVSYEDNVNAGTATVIVEGIGKYKGTKKLYFTIEPRDISNAHVTYQDQEWTGSAIEPLEKIIVDGNTLENGKDFTVKYSNNINIGQGKMVITGIGNYSGTIAIKFNINKVSLSNIKVYGMTTQTYTGYAFKPIIPEIIYDGKTLTNGTDYAITYKNNVNVGTAQVIITGKGKYYTGSTTATFEIVAKSISASQVSAIADKTYTGSQIKPSPTVKVGNITLKKGTDYTLSYKNNTKTGKATITITGKGNYKGTKTVTFNIVPKKVTINSLTSPKKKTLKLTWTKTSLVTGYQIQYSTSSKFTGATSKVITSYKTSTTTISGLKSGKKYYVRIRGYKTIGGVKKYGAWTTKNIKVK